MEKILKVHYFRTADLNKIYKGTLAKMNKMYSQQVGFYPK